MSFEAVASEAQRLSLNLRWGAVPHDLLPAPTRPEWIQVSGKDTLVRLPDGWRVLVSGGTEIVVQSPDEGNATEDSADSSWIIDTWAIPIAMMQRGLLSLHASSVVVNGSTIAIAGNSGAGKSTTALGLRARGHFLLVDEATLCEVLPDQVLVHPYRRRLHLTAESIEYFGLDASLTRPVAMSQHKFSVDPDVDDFSARTLRRIVVIRPYGGEGSPAIEALPSSASVPFLAHLTARRGMARQILGPQRYLAALTGLAERTEVYALNRPVNRWSLDEVLDGIEELDG